MAAKKEPDEDFRRDCHCPAQNEGLHATLDVRADRCAADVSQADAITAMPAISAISREIMAASLIPPRPKLASCR